MFKNYSKNIVIFSIILSLILSSFTFFPKETLALDSDGGGGGIGGGGDGDITPGGVGVIEGIFNTLCGVSNAPAAIGNSLFNNGLSFLSGGGGGGAEVPVDDKKNNAKEKYQDCIAWMAAKFMVRHIVDDLAKWIRGGANGKPRFIQDFGKYLTEAADTASGLLLEQILGKEDAQLLCKPWRMQIVLDIFDKVKRDKFSFKAQCKISDIIENYEEFYDDFSKGGWPAFLTIVLDDGSNPIGSYLMTLSEKEKRESFALKKGELEAKVNQGSLPGICLQSFVSGVTGKKNCVRSKILTPGAAIIEMLPETFSTELRQLEAADEINELVAAVIDAIRMKRFWRDGLAGSDDEDEDGRIWPGWRDDADDWNPGTQLPLLLKPKNNQVITGPITFEWKGGQISESAKSYLLLITYPDGTESRIKVPAPADGEKTVTYTQSQEEFENMYVGGEYEWKVSALSEGEDEDSDEDDEIIGGILGFSDPRIFIIPAPNLLTPRNGTVLTKNINFTWTPVRGMGKIDYYKLEIQTPNGSKKEIISDNASYLVDKTEFDSWEGGEYSWKVAGFRDDEIVGRFSVESNFIILSSPILESPGDGAEISLPFTFNWSDVQGFTESELGKLSYEIRITKKGVKNFTFESTDSQTEISIDDLGNKAENFGYAWDVRAIITNEEGGETQGDWSAKRDFKIKAGGGPPPAGTPTANAKVSLTASKSNALESLTFDEGANENLYLFGEDSAPNSGHEWICGSEINFISDTKSTDANPRIKVPASVNTDTEYKCSLTVKNSEGVKSSPDEIKITIKNKILSEDKKLAVHITEEGRITSDTGDVNCEAKAGKSEICTYFIKENTDITFTAAPALENTIKMWGGDCAGTPITQTQCAIKMTGEKTVIVIFGK